MRCTCAVPRFALIHDDSDASVALPCDSAVDSAASTVNGAV
jgi:hypothetical protein